MWAKIIGALLVLSGGIFLISPERFRRRLKKKTVRTIRRYLFAAASCLGILLISAGWQHEGALPKILVVVGIIVLLKGMYLLKAKSADIIVAWLLKVPTVYLRVFALCQVLAGVLILSGLKQ